ncbi:MAG: NAD(P)/FAD-dependent oxidoreductase [Marinilabiliales bacterium]|nr:NAD(P)/FAD-dependent oxidoreductase [Marinilabiliales bacterium]
MVTRGGVALEGASMKETMEFETCYPTLYFAGEVLDIDGDTGGYNLQAAFSNRVSRQHTGSVGGWMRRAGLSGA